MGKRNLRGGAGVTLVAWSCPVLHIYHSIAEWSMNISSWVIWGLAGSLMHGELMRPNYSYMPDDAVSTLLENRVSVQDSVRMSLNFLFNSGKLAICRALEEE